MTVHVPPTPQTPDGLVRRTFDADDVRRMVEAGILGEDERVELVEGELIAMSAKGFAHDRVKNALVAQCNRSLPAEVYVAVESTLQLSRSVMLEPDILVARRADVVPSPQGFATVDGPKVLLAIEVAVSSLAYDRGRKAALYARFGVPEYWVIDANERCAWVHVRPDGDSYAEVAAVARDGTLHPQALELAALSIDLAPLG